MGKWALNLTFEEGDEVAAQRIESTERLANRLLDLAVTALPIIAKKASRQASIPRPFPRPAEDEDVVTHPTTCSCRACRVYDAYHRRAAKSRMESVLKAECPPIKSETQKTAEECIQKMQDTLRRLGVLDEPEPGTFHGEEEIPPGSDIKGD